MQKLADRYNSNCNKHATYVYGVCFTAFYILNKNTFYLVFSLDFFYYGIPQNFYIFQCTQFFLKGFCSTQLIPPMNQIYFFTISCKKNGIFYCHITATDNCNCSSFKEGSIACCTIRNSHTGKLLFARHAKLCMLRPHGCHYGFCLQFSFICRNEKTILHLFHTKCLCFLKFASQLICMFPEFHSQVKPIDSRKARIIVNFISCQHLTAAHGILFNRYCLQTCTLCINRCGKSRRSCAYNNHIIHGVPPFLLPASIHRNYLSRKIRW